MKKSLLKQASQSRNFTTSLPSCVAWWAWLSVVPRSGAPPSCWIKTSRTKSRPKQPCSASRRPTFPSTTAWPSCLPAWAGGAGFIKASPTWKQTLSESTSRTCPCLAFSDTGRSGATGS
ncbi:hypothetical protein Chor_014712 [Crotalus horridus]